MASNGMGGVQLPSLHRAESEQGDAGAAMGGEDGVREGKSTEEVGETRRECRNKAKEERKIQQKGSTLAGKEEKEILARNSKGIAE